MGLVTELRNACKEMDGELHGPICSTKEGSMIVTGNKVSLTSFGSSGERTTFGKIENPDKIEVESLENPAILAESENTSLRLFKTGD